LAAVADAVCSSQPEGVVEVSLAAFGFVAAPVEVFEVSVVWWDGTRVFGAIEFADRPQAPGQRSGDGMGDPIIVMRA